MYYLVILSQCYYKSSQFQMVVFGKCKVLFWFKLVHKSYKKFEPNSFLHEAVVIKESFATLIVSLFCETETQNNLLIINNLPIINYDPLIKESPRSFKSDKIKCFASLNDHENWICSLCLKIGLIIFDACR